MGRHATPGRRHRRGGGIHLGSDPGRLRRASRDGGREPVMRVFGTFEEFKDAIPAFPCNVIERVAESLERPYEIVLNI